MSARRVPPRLEHGNGSPGPAAFDDELLDVPAPDGRWIVLGCGLCLASAALVGLGVWKAVELIGHAA